MTNEDNVYNMTGEPLREEESPRTPLQNGGGDGTYSGMNERVARLEAIAENTEKRLDRIDGKLDRVLERIGTMPTINGLWGMIATVIGVSIAMVGIVLAAATYFSPA